MVLQQLHYDLTHFLADIHLEVFKKDVFHGLIGNLAALILECVAVDGILDHL